MQNARTKNLGGCKKNEQHLLVVSVCQNELQKYDEVHFFFVTSYIVTCLLCRKKMAVDNHNCCATKFLLEV